MDKVTMDTANLGHIPESKRSEATSYESLVCLYTESDLRHDLIPEGKSVGDVNIPSHTRYSVTYTE